MIDENIVQTNDSTMMIDYGLFGLKRVGAVYLVQAGKKCLIDSGTTKEVKNIISALDAMGAFPPDMIILTHSHWDHTQGTPRLCKEAEKRGKKIEVFAGEKAIDNLKDQSWNRVFNAKQSFLNIESVKPLSEGEILDIDGLKLEVLDFAGHCVDDIALYDKKNKTVFVGDSVGYKIENVLTFPPFMPPFWDSNSFYATLEKLKQIDYEKLCLAHFGCLEGEAAKKFPDETAETCKSWWTIFNDVQKKDKLDDVNYIKERILQETNVVLPDLEINKTMMRIMLNVINTFKKLTGKKQIQIAEVQLEGIITWLTKGYKIYTEG